MKFLLALLFFLTLGATAEAATYWVSATGGQTGSCNQASGTSDPGFYIRRIDSGISCMGASGDRVFIKSGTYGNFNGDGIGGRRDANGVCTQGICPPNGTPSQFTQISAAPGHEGKVLMLSNGGSLVQFYGPFSYIKISGIIFDGQRDVIGWNQAQQGIEGNCVLDDNFPNGKNCELPNSQPGYPHNFLFEDVEVRNWARNGILGWGTHWHYHPQLIGTYIIFRRMNVHHNGSERFEHGMYLGSSGNLIENGRFYMNYGLGIQLHTQPESEGGDPNIYNEQTIIRGNLFWDNGAALVTESGPIWVYNNTSKLKGGNPGGGTSAKLQITYTINSFLYNNTVVGGDACMQVDFSSGNLFRNNLCVDVGTQFQGDTSGNIFQNNQNLTTAANIFVDPSADNYQLKTGTVAPVNAGLDVSGTGNFNYDANGVTRPQGAAWDIGACEWFASATSCPNFQTAALPPSPVVTITTPTSNPTFATSSPNLPTLAGNVNIPVTSVTWTCSTCSPTSGTATGTTSWSQSNIGLTSGINTIVVTATTSGGQQGTDTLGVTYTPTFPGNALVGAWGFEEGTGTSVADQSGNSNNGALLNGAGWSTNGKFGKAVSLDGVNDYVNVADSNSLDFTQSFTLSAWVFPTAVHTDWRAAIVKNYTSFLYATTGGSGTCASGGILGGFATSATTNVVCQNSAIPVGQWTHLAVAYDNAAATLTLYRDGVQVATLSVSGLMAPTNQALQIGASTFGENFEGLIDEVRAYNWKIPVTAGSNTVPGATCVFGNPLDTAQQSIIRDMNCPVIQTITPPNPIKLPASATGLKIGPSATGLKFGSKAP